ATVDLTGQWALPPAGSGDRGLGYGDPAAVLQRAGSPAAVPGGRLVFRQPPMTGSPVKKIARLWRHLVIDLSPLRRSRDPRRLTAGQLFSVLGAQLTTVAVPYQVYSLTHSSLAVGLASLAQLLPLIAGGLLGGSLADAADR